MNEKLCPVIISPQTEPHEYPVGTKIIDVLRKENPGFPFPCNGKGTCGKCRVKVQGLVNEPTEREKAKLDAAELAASIRLACQTEVRGPLRVETAGTRDPKHILSLGRFELPDLNPLWSCFWIQRPSNLTWEEISGQLKPGFLPSLTALRQLGELRTENGNLCIETIGQRVIAIGATDSQPERYGVAVDIGTTTLAAYLVYLGNGSIIQTASAYNPQASFGADVISRIGYCNQPDGLATLHRVILEAINRLIGELCETAKVQHQDVLVVYLVGNSCMTHLFCGVNPERMGKLPFEPVFKTSQFLAPAEAGLEINSDGIVAVLPGIGGFVGADISAGVLTCRLEPSKKELLIDIGTNGEVVLSGNGRMLACSTAAGPAFEGAGISCGMLAGPGAITDLQFTPAGIRLTTLDNQPARGICGTGLIRIITEFLRKGIITETGNFDPDLEDPAYDPGQKRYYLLRNDDTAVYVSQADIRQFQLAKGAIRAGLELMLLRLGISGDALETFYIAGAFGNYMSPADAIYIGLLPEIPAERIQIVGNTAGLGAVVSMLSQPALAELTERVSQIEHIELAHDPRFMDTFTEAMLFLNQE